MFNLHSKNKIYDDAEDAYRNKGIFKDNFGNLYDFKKKTVNGIKMRSLDYVNDRKTINLIPERYDLPINVNGISYIIQKHSFPLSININVEDNVLRYIEGGYMQPTITVINGLSIKNTDGVRVLYNEKHRNEVDTLEIGPVLSEQRKKDLQVSQICFDINNGTKISNQNGQEFAFLSQNDIIHGTIHGTIWFDRQQRLYFLKQNEQSATLYRYENYNNLHNVQPTYTTRLPVRPELFQTRCGDLLAIQGKYGCFYLGKQEPDGAKVCKVNLDRGQRVLVTQLDNTCLTSETTFTGHSAIRNEYKDNINWFNLNPKFRLRENEHTAGLDIRYSRSVDNNRTPEQQIQSVHKSAQRKWGF